MILKEISSTKHYKVKDTKYIFHETIIGKKIKDQYFTMDKKYKKEYPHHFGMETEAPLEFRYYPDHNDKTFVDYVQQGDDFKSPEPTIIMGPDGFQQYYKLYCNAFYFDDSHWIMRIDNKYMLPRKINGWLVDWELPKYKKDRISLITKLKLSNKIRGLGENYSGIYFDWFFNHSKFPEIKKGKIPNFSKVMEKYLRDD